MKKQYRTFRLHGGAYTFQVSGLGRKLKDAPPPIAAAMGEPNEVWRLYESELADFRSSVGPEYVPTPFVFPLIGKQRFGDFTSRAGQNDFRRARLRLSEGDFKFARPAQELRRFADLAQILRFPKSEECACLRNLRVNHGQFEFEIGPAPYEEVFATMNSQGLRFDVTKEQVAAAGIFWGKRGQRELSALANRLRRRYGSVTVREVLYRRCKGLPRFGEPVCSYVLGAAAVITTRDGYAVFGRRAKRIVSLNLGVNVPTSGGFRFDRRQLVSLGFPRFVEYEILREVEEEIGITGSDCSVTVLAFVREVWRAGSPEILAAVEFYGTFKELLNLMRGNQHQEQDVDLVYAISLEAARKLIREPDAGKALQPKALVTLIMLDRHLRNGLA